MPAPTAERPLDALKILGELTSELRRREPLPPGDRAFSWRRTMAFQRDPLRFLIERYERHGPVFSIRFLHRPMVVLLGPEANHFVTVAGAEHFSWRRGMFGENLIPVLGDGLITSDGEHHDRARRIAMPAFHARRMDGAVAIMIELATTNAPLKFCGLGWLDFGDEVVAMMLPSGITHCGRKSCCSAVCVISPPRSACRSGWSRSGPAPG